MKHTGKILATLNEDINIINCVLCEFIHQDPLPGEKERNKYYKKKYYQETKVDYYKEQKIDLEYLNSRFSDEESILSENSNLLKKSILDIGAGSGLFLKFFEERGWHVKGIEPNNALCDIVKKELNIDLFCGTLNEFAKNNQEKFSVVHLADVLEHVVNPISILKTVFDKLLVPEGLISIEVPNDFNPLQKIIYSKLNNNWWVCDDHINYFNIKSLTNLLNNNRFDVIKTKVSFPIEIFVLMGDDYINNPNSGKSSHLRRVNLEKNLNLYNKNLKDQLYESFLNMGLGRTIMVIGRKKSF